MQVPTSKYPFNISTREGKTYIFDIFRKKKVMLTPEEWVRQQILWFLVEDLKYPAALFSLEHSLEKNGVKHRFDALLFDKAGNPWMMLEFKAAEISLTQDAFDQIFVYQKALQTPFSIVSNGNETRCFRYTHNGITAVSALPVYGEI